MTKCDVWSPCWLSDRRVYDFEIYFKDVLFGSYNCEKQKCALNYSACKIFYTQNIESYPILFPFSGRFYNQINFLVTKLFQNLPKGILTFWSLYSFFIKIYFVFIYLYLFIFFFVNFISVCLHYSVILQPPACLWSFSISKQIFNKKAWARLLPVHKRRQKG